MQQALRRSNLVPAGFVVESAFCDIETTVITVRPSQSFGLLSFVRDCFAPRS